VTVSPTIELATRTFWRHERLAEAIAGVIAFALLSGAWLAFFMFVPFDFRIG
jgi:hypothetical protein